MSTLHYAVVSMLLPERPCLAGALDIILIVRNLNAGVM